MDSRIQIELGDITKLYVDVIVNAANSSLMGGGGVDGAIHKAAGPELLEECKGISNNPVKCPPGEAVLTRGYNLPAGHIIHTVGPVWHGGGYGEDKILESCYKKTLEIAQKMKFKAIAFPSISTGVYGYPIELAVPIALKVISEFLRENDKIEMVKIVCFDTRTYNSYLDYVSKFM